MTQDAATRDSALSDLETAREDFETALLRAPDAALRYKPPGEDYALGGLVVHVTDVLRKYTRLLAALRAHDFGPLGAPDHTTPAEDATRIRDGFPGEVRGPVVEELRAAQMALIDAARLAGHENFNRQAAVTYGSGDPFPTSPADVLGWVTDHYREHTQQIEELVTAWAEATR
jgi:hypothetical protein